MASVAFSVSKRNNRELRSNCSFESYSSSSALTRAEIYRAVISMFFLSGSSRPGMRDT